MILARELRLNERLQAHKMVRVLLFGCQAKLSLYILASEKNLYRYPQDTRGFGVVYRPRWVSSGFLTFVPTDYYPNREDTLPLSGLGDPREPRVVGAPIGVSASPGPSRQGFDSGCAWAKMEGYRAEPSSRQPGHLATCFPEQTKGDCYRLFPMSPSG